MDRKAFAAKILRFHGPMVRQAQNTEGSQGRRSERRKTNGPRFVGHLTVHHRPPLVRSRRSRTRNSSNISVPSPSPNQPNQRFLTY